MFQIVAIFLTN